MTKYRIHINLLGLLIFFQACNSDNLFDLEKLKNTIAHENYLEAKEYLSEFSQDKLLKVDNQLLDLLKDDLSSLHSIKDKFESKSKDDIPQSNLDLKEIEPTKANSTNKLEDKFLEDIINFSKEIRLNKYTQEQAADKFSSLYAEWFRIKKNVSKKRRAEIESSLNSINKKINKTESQ